MLRHSPCGFCLPLSIHCPTLHMPDAVLILSYLDHELAILALRQVNLHLDLERGSGIFCRGRSSGPPEESEGGQERSSNKNDTFHLI